MTHRTYVALVFPGLGDPFDSVSRPDSSGSPLALFFGDDTVPGADAYLQVPGLVSVAAMSISIDPIKGSLDVGALSVEILTPPTGLVSESGTIHRLDTLLTRRIREAQGLLASPLDPSDFSVILFSRDGARFSTGDVIYIEREAIILGAVTGTNVTNKTQTFTISRRGAFGSVQRYHGATPGVGAPPTPISGFDNRVYVHPHPIGLECYLVEYDNDLGEIVVRWRGAITQEPRHAAGTASMTLEIPDIWALVANRKLNTQPLGASGEAQLIDYYSNYSAFYFSLTGNAFTQQYGPILVTEDSPRKAVVQIDKALIPVNAVDDVNGVFTYRATFPSPSGLVLDSKAPTTESDFDNRTAGNVTSPEFIWEILPLGYAVTDNQNNYWGAGYVIGAAGPKSAHHYVTAWLHMLLSTGTGRNSANYDKWSYQFGLGLPEYMVDVPGLSLLRGRTPDSGSIHALFFGAGGAEFSAGDFTEKLLPVFGTFPCLTSDYKITARRLDVLIEADITLNASDITILSEDQTYGWDDAANSIKVTYQQPWMDSAGSVIAIDRPRYTTWWDPAPEDPKMSRDVTALAPDTSIDISARQIAAKMLLDWVSKPIPKFVFEVNNPGQHIHVGMSIRLVVTSDDYIDGIWYDPDGVRIAAKEIYGYATQVSQVFGESRYTVEMWAVNDSLVNDPKYIVPTFEVESFTPDSGYVRVKRTSLHGVDLADFLSVTENPLRLFSQQAGIVAWSVSQSYCQVLSTTVNATTIDLFYAFEPTAAVSAGNFLRIATRATQSSTMRARYAFMAGPTETFINGTDGDIYL